ncbi:MAG: diphthine--ammonia ligase [Bacteroidota bacterium]|nr:diphthine--ammonia ligase [Bacteroidota bacterium]
MTGKTFFNWSGGKDSALALYHVLQDPTIRPELLVTSVNQTYNRVSMHGVREALLIHQANALGMPLQQLRMHDQPTMEEYNRSMDALMLDLHSQGYTHSVFGDIFLEDLRKYREAKLAERGFTAVFPLWKRDTRDLILEFLDLGFKTITTCVKAELLGEEFAGRIIDRDFLKDLPAGVDPCGENGEFHTFVFDGPIFKYPVSFKTGEKLFREYTAPKEKDDNCFTTENPPPKNMGFWFCDLIPV